jgi:hypothetical protein
VRTRTILARTVSCALSQIMHPSSIVKQRIRRRLAHPDRVSAARPVVGHPVKATFGVVIVATSGTRSTPEESVQLASISGP